ncbi:biliverdin-producing heme oxygenase [Agrobacterium sp. ES01]|uniref:biliverdin-producing heme oxygenase n=1 Tax=Agrobacterium sp. ES01 TaxID=3420714 RepID=UPI003D0A2156
MPSSERRWLLRSGTSTLHEELDRRVGSISDLGSYQRYLRGMMRFRGPLERKLADASYPSQLSGFTPCYIASSLQRDMMVVTNDQVAHAQEMSDIDLSTPEKMFGTLYVLEGSTLGSRLLIKQAAAIGIDETNGAEHLAKQSASGGNWKAFLALLESAEDLDDQAIIVSALQTFTVAIDVFEKI